MSRGVQILPLCSLVLAFQRSLSMAANAHSKHVKFHAERRTRIVGANPNTTAASTELAQQQCPTVSVLSPEACHTVANTEGGVRQLPKVAQYHDRPNRSSVLECRTSMRGLSRTYIPSAKQHRDPYGCRTGKDASRRESHTSCGPF